MSTDNLDPFAIPDELADTLDGLTEEDVFVRWVQKAIQEELDRLAEAA